jgi:hypothetical protein
LEEFESEVSWRLVIEAKIDAEEGEDQLSLYDDWLALYQQPTEVLRVFLTPDGRKPQTSSAEWQILSFLDLASVFRRVSGLQDKPGYHFLRYYLTACCGMSADCRFPSRWIVIIPTPPMITCNRCWASMKRRTVMATLGKSLLFYLKYPTEMERLYEAEEPNVKGLPNPDQVLEKVKLVGDAAN